MPRCNFLHGFSGADAIIAAAAAAAAAKVGYKPPHWNCTSEFLQKMEANVCISAGLLSISHISGSFFMV